MGGGFEASVWFRLARLLFEGNPQASAKVRVLRVPRDPAPVIRVTSPAGDELAEYLDDSPARLRFLERTGKAAPGGEGIFDRAGLLERLALFQGTEQERLLHKAGMKTQRQSWEESFWHRLAYHCAREFGPEPRHLPPGDRRGERPLHLHLSPPEGDPVVRFAVPRDRVRAALQLLAGEYPEQADLAIRPIPLMSIFRVTQETELDLEVRPVIRALQANGEERFFERRDFEQFRYGNLIYIKDLGVLAELEREGKERKFKAPVSMKLQRGQVASFLAEHQEALGAGTAGARRAAAGVADLQGARPHRDLRRRLRGGARPELVLAGRGVRLRQPDSVSLAEILRARKEGLPYLETAGGWIDLNAPVFRDLDRLGERGGEPLPAAGERAAAPPGRGGKAGAGGRRGGRRGHASAASSSCGRRRRSLAPRGIATTPRAYQRIGVDWLLFLVQNRLGGLLCDDMGLGKTLQVLALMVTLLERGEATEPFLVACPTSVLCHWRNQIHRHAPGLRPVVHHGSQRRLPDTLRPGDVLLTSYGVLRRDAEELSAVPFALAVFDEAQNLKNRGHRRAGRRPITWWRTSSWG